MPEPAPAQPRERSWIHWGVIVAALYILLFASLTLPLIFTCFIEWRDITSLSFIKKISAEPYNVWQYWAVLGVLALSQFLFLRVPVQLVLKRPVSRRSIWLPVIVSGFWFGLLIFGVTVALLEVSKQDKSERLLPFILAGAMVGWLIWTLVFLKISRGVEEGAAMRAQSHWLLRGSILELLIAVPSHIYVRQRGECCAGILTFFGITMGITVMLLSFGPAVFLLYHARWRRLRQKR